MLFATTRMGKGDKRMNQQQRLSRLRVLHAAASGCARQFDLGDHVALGIATFGRTAAFDAADTITGAKHTRNFFTRCVAVASYYPASLRFPALQFHTYEALRRFPLDFLSRFIPAVEPRGLSCAQIYELAVEQYGSDPRLKRKSIKVHSVRLPERLYQALAARAEPASQAHVFIAKVLEDYLAAQGTAKADAPGSPTAMGVAKDEQPAQPESPIVPESPRPPYSERRTSKYTSKVEIAFTECRGQGKDFLDSKTGAVQFGKRVKRADSFRRLEDALKAAEEYSLDRGYVVVPFMCKACSNGTPVYHLRAQAEVDLSKEQAEIRATVQDFIAKTRASLHHAQA